jgi:phasin family protein
MSTTKIKALAADTLHTVEANADAGAKGFEKTLLSMKEGMEKATKGFESSHVKLKESVEKAMKSSEEMMAFGQGNLEALIAASKIFASGMQEISKGMAASSKASIEESVSFTKTLIGVKSVKEAVDLQSGFARAAIEKAVSQTNRVTDASVKLAEQAIAPLTARLTLAVEKFGKGV